MRPARPRPVFGPLALFAAFALPGAAAAQDSCGTARWIGGSELGANLSTAFGPITEDISVAATAPTLLRFAVDTATEVRVEAQGIDGADPVAELYRADGGFIAEDDDGGGNLASRIETFVDGGVYCLSVRGYDARAIGVTVRVGLMEHEPLTAGFSSGGSSDNVCTPGTEAAQIADGPLDLVVAGGATEVVGSAASQPFWRFTLSEPTRLTLTAENEAADPILALYSGTGSLIDENDDFDGLNSRLDFVEPLEAGEYCVALSALSDADAPITLGIEIFDESSFLRERYDLAEMSPPPGSDYPVTDLGTLGAIAARDVVIGDRAQWVRFRLEEPGLVLAQALGSGDQVDTVLTLFRETGQQIDMADDYGGSRDARMATPLERGVYLLAVTNYSGGSGSGAARLILERYVRADEK
ncbi:MAG: DVUA0089 family protein [Pseudomonadota bacterium]